MLHVVRQIEEMQKCKMQASKQILKSCNKEQYMKFVKWKQKCLKLNDSQLLPLVGFLFPPPLLSQQQH